MLVGRRGLHAVNLSDGKPAWEGSVPLPAGSNPSGRGFSTGNRYYLPLSSAEVAAVDLDAGKIAQTSKSREGEDPRQPRLLPGQGDFAGLGRRGGLLPGRTRSARRSAAAWPPSPTTPRPCDSAAKCFWTRASWPTRIGSLRRAYQLVADERTRELLRDVALGRLAHGLRRPIAARTAEIERLLDDPSPAGRLLAADGRRLAEDGPVARRRWTITCD